MNTDGLGGAGPSKITLASHCIPCHENRFKCLGVNVVEVVDDKIPPQNALSDMCDKSQKNKHLKNASCTDNYVKNNLNKKGIKACHLNI